MNAALLELLEKLARLGEDNDARETERPKRMLNITRDTRRLLWIVVHATGATRILEVGTSNASSTIWLADAARSTRGRVTTLELNPEKIALARANLAAAGLDVVVEIIEGRAAETLATRPGPFDLVFLDADRPSYPTYLELGQYLGDRWRHQRHRECDERTRSQAEWRLLSVSGPVKNAWAPHGVDRRKTSWLTGRKAGNR